MPDETADNNYLARSQANSDQRIAQAYLAANPDRAAAFGVASIAPTKPNTPASGPSPEATQPPGIGATAGPQGPDTANEKGNPLASMKPESMSEITREVPRRAALAAGASPEQANQLSQLTGAAGMVAPLVAPLLGKDAAAESAVGEGEALAESGAASAPEALPKGTILDAQGQPMNAPVATGAAQEAGPATAANEAAHQLAAKQIEALKEARVGKTTAEEFGRGDIATSIPEEQTMREAAALRATVEPFYGDQRPRMAAHTAAFAKTYQDEAAGIRQDALDIASKGAAGEDTTEAESALQNRFAAYAINYANLAGTRSEMGRALQILDPLKPGNLFAADTAKLAQEIAADPNANLVSKLSALNPDRASIMAREMGEASAQGRSVTGMIREYYMNALLSKPSTFVAKKMTGDMTSYALEAPTRWIAAKIPMWGGEKVAPEEASAFAKQSILATQDALRVAKLTFENGTSAVDALGGAHGTAFEPSLKLPEIRGDGSGDFISKSMDLLGDVVRIPSRSIQAETDFAYMMNYRGQLGALAARTARSEALAKGLSGDAAGQFIQERSYFLNNSPTPAMVDGAHSLAQQNTFTTPLGPTGQAFSQGLDKLSDYIPGLGRMLFPFRQVPINLQKYAIGHSPLALLTRSFYSDVAQGGAAGQLALAKLGLGSAVALMAGKLYMDGSITGGGPTNPKDYHNQLATGWKPYAIHDGSGNYYTYDRLSPLGEMLGLPADFMTLMGEAPQADLEHAGVALAGTIGRNMTRQSYVETLANVNNLIDSLRTGDSMQKALSKFGAQEVSGIIPAAVRGEAKREDPVLRDTRGFMDNLLSSVPGYSASLPPHRDLQANPILIPPGFMANEVYPFQIGAEAHNPVANEIFETGASLQKPPDILPGTGRAPRMSDQATNPDVGVPLDKFQKDRWQVLRATYKDEQQGTMTDALNSLMTDPEYRDLAKEDKAKQIEKIVLDYGKAASQQLLAEDASLRQKYAIRQQNKVLGHMPTGGDPQAFLRSNGLEPVVQ